MVDKKKCLRNIWMAPKVGRLDYLLDVIEPDVDKKRKVLIFCNKATTSAYINHSLNDQGISTLHFAGSNMNPSTRQHNLNMFMNEDDCNVLACTDLVSRGINLLSFDDFFQRHL